ncbi:ABC transporter ATP-binding protein [Endothiovibrio diazotrophicus]
MPALHLHALATDLLQPLELTVAAGECIALRGPSGSGKSRLLRAIADLDPAEGSVSLNGEVREGMPAPHWRRRVGLLGAESQWWHDRVGEHFPRVDAERLHRLGFDGEVLEWEVSRLSSGEKQRLALARLLANEPEALLLDEPTANLDHDNGARVEALIADYRREREAAVIWVGHDPAQLDRVAERRFRIDGGRLVEETGR